MGEEEKVIRVMEVEINRLREENAELRKEKQQELDIATGYYRQVVGLRERVAVLEGENQALEIALDAAKSVMSRDVLADFHELLKERRGTVAKQESREED